MLKNEITTEWELEEKYISQMKTEMLDVISLTQGNLQEKYWWILKILGAYSFYNKTFTCKSSLWDVLIHSHG